MPSINPVQEILDLLKELEVRTLENTRLVEEWNASQLDYPGEIHTAERLQRFKEWFLVERISKTLGVPPLVAFSPAASEPEDAWARLMDSILGIFQPLGGRRLDDGKEALSLCDIWSGREILIPSESFSPGGEMDEHTLLFGRFVQVEEPFHAPLPNVLKTSIPELLPALEKDISEARKRQTRAKLSQRELEKIIHSIPDPCDSAVRSLKELETELASILLGQSKWHLEHLQTSLAGAGLTETLNALAFDTDLDIENLRRILPEYYQALAHEEEPDKTSKPRSQDPDSLDKPLPTNRIEAVEMFHKQRSEGTPMQQSFAELEKALGLPEGSSEEMDLETTSNEDLIGMDSSKGMWPWIEGFTWEQKLSKTPDILIQWATFLDKQGMGNLDAQDLKPEYLVPFLLSAGEPSAVKERHSQLRSFLDWAETEQGAQLGALAKSESELFINRFIDLLKMNLEIGKGKKWKQTERLLSLKPLTVATDNPEEGAMVKGITLPQQNLLRVGDLLLGSWIKGSFEVVGVLPQEAIPQGVNKD